MRLRGWAFLSGVVVGGTLVAIALAGGCGSTPGATSLPEDESRIRTVGGDPVPRSVPRSVPRPPAPAPAPAAGASADAGTAPETPQPVPAPAPTPAPTAPVFAALQLEDVRGGELAFELPGTVAQVTEMLLDFDRAAGHRSWAERYSVVSRAEDRVVARWAFRGKMGVNPTVQIEFRPVILPDLTRIRYRLVDKDFGIASFFGDYRIEPLPGDPPRVRLTERVFIDSGLPFVNATHEDIESGLREDADLMRAWMRARLSGGR